MWGWQGLSWKQTWDTLPCRLYSLAWHSVSSSFILHWSQMEPPRGRACPFTASEPLVRPGFFFVCLFVCSFIVFLPKVNCSPSPFSRQVDLFPDSCPLGSLPHPLPGKAAMFSQWSSVPSVPASVRSPEVVHSTAWLSSSSPHLRS